MADALNMSGLIGGTTAEGNGNVVSPLGPDGADYRQCSPPLVWGMAITTFLPTAVYHRDKSTTANA